MTGNMGVAFVDYLPFWVQDKKTVDSFVERKARQAAEGTMLKSAAKMRSSGYAHLGYDPGAKSRLLEQAQRRAKKA